MAFEQYKSKDTSKSKSNKKSNEKNRPLDLDSQNLSYLNDMSMNLDSDAGTGLSSEKRKMMNKGSEEKNINSQNESSSDFNSVNYKIEEGKLMI